MRSFSDHGDRFFEGVQIVGGPRTRAIIQSAEDQVNVNDQFIIPRTIARVKLASLIVTGAVIQVAGGQRFLCADHGADDVWRTHLLLPCDRQVLWTRTTSTPDPVTGLPRAGGAPQDMGQPWAYWERPVRPPTDQTTRLPNVDYVVATAAPIVQGDLVNGQSVIRHDTCMGLTIVGVRS